MRNLDDKTKILSFQKETGSKFIYLFVYLFIYLARVAREEL